MNAHSILQLKGRDVATVAADVTLAAAAAELDRRKIGALVVSGDGATIDGIISERDVVRAVADQGAAALDGPVNRYMSADVVTCCSGDSVDDLMATMTEQRIRHLPVVDDGGGLDGIVSIGDVVKQRIGQLTRENDQLFDYLQGR